MMNIDWAAAMFGETFTMRGPDGTVISLVRAESAQQVIDRIERERDATRPVVEIARAWRAAEITGGDIDGDAYADLAAAVDAYETQGGSDDE